MDRESWSVPIDRVRGVIAAGADGLPQWQRPIYLGFVIGDDRGSSESMVDAFERSGLSHLLVVSGQNVAFVLIVASPVLSRLGRRRRLGVTIAILLMFAAVVRFEPSVLRAVAMAGVVAVGTAGGRRAPAPVVLANAVAIVVLLDPLLVASLGFRLSVAATLGIVTLSAPIAARLRGPRWLTTGVAVCVAAQFAVAPLLVPTFGPLRLISIPANVLAEPAAALVMMWGCTGGVVAGAVGGPLGVLLALPSRLAIWWICAVATTASELPSPEVGLRELAGITLMVVCVGLVRRRRRSTRDPMIAV
jgi:competence protein ComEC